MTTTIPIGTYVRRTDGRGGPRTQVGWVSPHSHDGCIHVVWDSGDVALIGADDLEPIEPGQLPVSTIVHYHGTTARVSAVTEDAYELATVFGRRVLDFTEVHGKAAS